MFIVAFCLCWTLPWTLSSYQSPPFSSEWIEKNTEDSIEHHEIRLNAWCLTGLSNKEGAEKSIKKSVVAQGQRWHSWCSNRSSVCLLFENDHCAVVHELLMLCAKYWVTWENGDGRYCGVFIVFLMMRVSEYAMTNWCWAETGKWVLSCSRYTFSSMESQIRVLADYAFMLRDYDLALSNYRLLSSDYKTDKAWKHYAGVQVCSSLRM